MPEPLPQPKAPRLRPAGPIVSASQIGIWSEAQAGLAAVHRHAVEVRAWAAETVERERAQARIEGRAEGAEEAARLVAQTSARAGAHLAALESELPALVHGIVAEILGAFDPAERLARIVAQAVSRLRPEAEATLRVAPGDIEGLRTALQDLGADHIQIEADPALAPGECCLRSPIGSVELGVEAQLRALQAGLAPVAKGLST